MRRLRLNLFVVLLLGIVQVASVALALCREEAFGILDEGLQRALLLMGTDRAGADLWCLDGPIVFRRGVLPDPYGNGISGRGPAASRDACPPGRSISARDAVLTPQSFGLEFSCNTKLDHLLDEAPDERPPTVVPEAVESRMDTPHERWYLVAVRGSAQEMVRDAFIRNGERYGSTAFHFEELGLFLVNVQTITQFAKLIAGPIRESVVHIMENAPLVPALGNSVQSLGWPNDDLAPVAGQNRRIAIVDFGVAPDFFPGRIVLEACFSSREYLLAEDHFTEPTCPAGSRRTEHPEPIFQTAEARALGTEWYQPVYAVGAGSGDRCDADRVQPRYPCDHGTQVAYVAAGSDPSSTDEGLATGAEIVSVQVASLAPANYCRYSGGQPCAVVMPLDVLRALYFLHRNVEAASRQPDTPRLVAINISLALNGICNQPGPMHDDACDDGDADPEWVLGSYAEPCENAFSDWIAKLAEKGVHTVVAAGNRTSSEPHGVVSLPGCVEGAITVGSSTSEGFVAEHSKLSSRIDFLAPGEEIYTPLPGGPLRGTSYAAPFVSAALALADELHGHCADPSAASLEWLSGQRTQVQYDSHAVDLHQLGIDPEAIVLSLRDTKVDCR